MIPGQPNLIRIRATNPGVYRGQYAEFCGARHAHMGMVVIAQDAADYQKWLEEQRRIAAQPATPQAQAGKQVFLSGTCSLCHTIRGVNASGQIAPDLTHIGSR